MTLLQLTKEILAFHAQTLSLIEELLSDELTVYILEKHAEENSIHLLSHQEFFEAPTSTDASADNDSFEDLSNFVESLGLNIGLKFYLWAFPLYRTIIEDRGSLSQILKLNQDSNLEKITDITCQNLKKWAENIPLPDNLKNEFYNQYEINLTQFRERLIQVAQTKKHLSLV